MNFASYIQSLIALIRPLLALGGDQAHAVVERWVTIPKSVREKLFVGMAPGEVVEAERLFKVAADAISDAAVYVASRGAVEAD